MEELLKYVKDNEALIGACAWLVVSEVMGANPNWKYNGVLHLVVTKLFGARK